ncbi:Periplasmic copper-binding protein (NosD) [uncultured archaeon]|nr:Periplasmic copper-binding protein (NosD) [uncultured archaeon]
MYGANTANITGNTISADSNGGNYAALYFDLASFSNTFQGNVIDGGGKEAVEFSSGSNNANNRFINDTVISATNGYLVTTAAANLTIDCAGASITGTNASSSTGVYSTQFNTTVKNCVISNFQDGINFYAGASNSTIDNVTATATKSNSNAILIGSNTTVSNSVAASAYRGIVVGYLSSNSNIVNSSGYATADSGLFLSYSTGTSITNSSGSSNSGHAIYLDHGSLNSLTGTNGTSNTTHGLILIGSSNNSIWGGRFIGASDSFGSLTIIVGSQYNTVSNATIDGNGKAYAASLQIGANTGNRIVNSTIMNAATLLYLDSTSGGNTFYRDNFTNGTGLYANDTNGTNYYNTTVSGKAQGNFWQNVMNGSVNIFDADADVCGESGSQYPYNSTNSLGKLSGSMTDWGPAVVTTRTSFVVKTYFNGSPSIYFANGSVANITTAAPSAPTITIIDPSGAMKVNNSAMNGSGTYYYEYTVNGAAGWYNVTLTSAGGASFNVPQMFYAARPWLDNFTDASGNAFTARVPFNATEPDATERWFEPMNVSMNTSLGANESSLRILVSQGGQLFDIPAQFHSYNYSMTNGRVVSASADFVDVFGLNQTKNYYYAYSFAPYGLPNYAGDLSSSNGSTSTFSNMHFSVNTSAALGGTLSSLYSKYSALELRGSAWPMPAPEVKFSSVVVNDPTTAQSYSYSNGSIYAKYEANGTTVPVGVVNYSLTYTFYSRAPYFLLETNSTSALAVGNWDYYRDANLALAKAKFDNLTYQNSTGTFSQNLSQSGAGADTNITNASWLAFTSVNLRDGVAFIPVARISSHAYNSTMAAQDAASNYSFSQNAYTGAIASGDRIYTKSAIMVYDPADTWLVNRTRIALLNPVGYSFGAVERFVIAPPYLAEANYTPQSPNDTNSVTCFSYWNSTIDLSSATINFTSRAYSNTSTVPFNATSGWANYTVGPAFLQTGNASCYITVYDVLGQPSNTTISFTASDRKPPVAAVNYTPSAAPDVDPNVTITVDANLTEYTDVDAAVLQYSPDGITYTNVPMARAGNSSGWFVYEAAFTPDREANYSVRIYANDTLGNSNTSNVTVIPVFWDWTWERTPASFGSVGAQPGTNATLMNLTINVTGDKPLSFRIKSNYGTASGGMVYYDGLPEDQLQGSQVYNITNGSGQAIEVSATARLTGGVVPITFTITPLNASAEPLSNTTTGTFISTNESVFLYAEFVSPPTSVVQGQTGVVLRAKVTNYGLNGTADNTTLNWTLPSGWSDPIDPLSVGIGNLAPGDSSINTLSYVVISSGAPTGIQTVSISTACAENSTYAASALVNVISSGPGPTPGPSPSPGGGGGGGGGGSKNGTYVPPKPVEKNLTQAQQSELFNTLSTYELVRGKDSTFNLNITNPTDADINNVTINLTGYLYQYINIDPAYISSIPAGQSRVVKIRIAAPKYFTEGTFTLYFDIRGFSVTQNDTAIITTTIHERRTVELKILEMSRSDAFNDISSAYRIRDQMKDAGVYHGTIVDLMNDAEASYKSDKFGQLALDLDAMRELRAAAFDAKGKLSDFKGKLDTAASEDIPTPQSSRLYSLANSAFERGDYNNAMLRLNEAELTYALETTQSFSLEAFVKKYWPQILAGLAIISVVGLIVFVDVRFWLMDNELFQLNKEEGIVLGLIKEVQDEYFEKGKMSTGEYTYSVQQNDARLSKIVERKVELEKMKKNYFNFKGRQVRLASEKARLEELIRELQTAYLEEGKVETRVYENRMKSYVTRLSEVEEQLAVNEAEAEIRRQENIFTRLKNWGKSPPEPPKDGAA